MTGIADLRSMIPESWACIDCGFNTAPGLLNRAQMEARLLAVRFGAEGILSIHSPARRGLWQGARVSPARVRSNEKG
jgi:hypothetical protein